MSNVFELSHPLATDHLSRLRSIKTASADFRHRIKVLTTMLAVEATRQLKTRPARVTTPLAEIETQEIDPAIAIVPILRAGLGMVDPLLELIPQAKVWHLGMFRDEETATPVRYYDKVPRDQMVNVVFIVDPMLATGGSANMAIDILKECDVSDIRMLSIIAAPEGIRAVQKQHPDVDLYSCAIDNNLNNQSYIVPGLGDAGDRIFNT